MYENESNPATRRAKCLAYGLLVVAAMTFMFELGRQRGPRRNAPRTADVDLLLYGPEVRARPSLTLPHPRLPERRFVLVPLVEIAPHAVHPTLGLTVRELLDRCPDRSRVTLMRSLGTGAA